MASAALARRMRSRGRQGSARAVNEDGTPYLTIRPQGNVYSYFLFSGPVETSKPHEGYSSQFVCSILLLFFNVIVQTFLLCSIFSKETLGHFRWVDGIHAVGKDLSVTGSCNDGKSLCHDISGTTISCAPPTVALTGNNFADWSELDLNGDGIWTLAEVKDAKDELYCRYHVDPFEVFNVYATFAMSHSDKLWIHPLLANRTAIHRPYFTFVAGDIIMCGYGNADICPNLLRRGVFDAALDSRTSTNAARSRVGTSITDAMDYCHSMLDEGGICDSNLPSTYGTWRKTSNQQCLAPTYESFKYTVPGGLRSRSLLAVNYAGVYTYMEGKKILFTTYKMILVFIYILGMASELKEIFNDITFVVNFPNASEFDGQSCAVTVNESTEVVKYNIQAASTMHKTMVSVLIMVRLATLAILSIVGIAFLLKESDYTELLLNTVGLVFIIDIQFIIYMQVVNTDLREEHEEREPLAVPMLGIAGSLNRHPAIRDALSFVILFVVIIVGFLLYYSWVLIPLSDSLACTCLGQGAKCLERERFSSEFWKGYWEELIPSVFDDLKTLKDDTYMEDGSAIVQKAPRDFDYDEAIDDTLQLAARARMRGGSWLHRALSVHRDS